MANETGNTEAATRKLEALDPLLHPQDRDMLHQKSRFVEHFYELVTESVNPPFSISIDGLWGSGKTTVMKLLQHKLHEEGGFSTFWFNPWEYRKTENVVLAFLQSLAAQHSDLVDQLPSKGLSVMKVLLKEGIQAALNVLTMKSVSLKNVEADLSKAEKDGKPSYDEYLDSIKVLKREFKTLIDAIGRKYSQHTVIIFFDDLDRCLPDDAIELLEAVKNLFVTPGCKCIFICGIDTHIAKQFIRSHYKNIEESFAMNYFRKIFNLTFSMPANPPVQKVLDEYIRNLTGLDAGESKELSRMIASSGLQAEMTSVRKFLNVANNFYVFRKFNPDYTFNPKEDFVVYLLLIKEAWEPLYRELIQEALKNSEENVKWIVEKVVTDSNAQDEALSKEQEEFLQNFLVHPFGQEGFHEKLADYPTLP